MPWSALSCDSEWAEKEEVLLAGGGHGEETPRVPAGGARGSPSPAGALVSAQR